MPKPHTGNATCRCAALVATQAVLTWPVSDVTNICSAVSPATACSPAKDRPATAADFTYSTMLLCKKPAKYNTGWWWYYTIQLLPAAARLADVKEVRQHEKHAE